MARYRLMFIPLLSLVILTVGGALLNTFLALNLESSGANSFLVGSLTTGYFVGMVVGAFKLEGLILRVGHIRAYSAFASLLAVAAMLHGFYIGFSFWLLLRLIEGFATAGLYIVIESWILGTTNNANRGAFLALYMIAVYLAQAGGQFLLTIASHETLMLYCISGILASLSVIPLALSKTVTPIFSEPEPFSIKTMLKMSPSGMSACFVAGMVLGNIYGLYPIFIRHLGYSNSEISTVMGLTIFGGMLFQYPVGRLSDVFSRRSVLAVLAIVSMFICLAIISVGHESVWLMGSLSFALGGMVFCLYPIGISHACDRVKKQQVVSATQTLLFSWGTGAALGPIIAPIFDQFMPN
ncbi:MFS transporter [uncultured Shewanella sp.]|uniref:MFS transporter n=1 Tax=uncultured Shewanella sp. TaxID=173975 RepID=UPI00262BA7C0|nr:MFS transporter [uncultured Shewanella sp.]